MIVAAIQGLQDNIFKKCESFTGKKNWIIFLTLSLPLIALFFSFPSYERLNTEFAHGWKAILEQANNPFTNNNYAADSHQAKLTFRLTMPLIAYVLHLGVMGILILQALTGTLMLYFSIKLFERITQDKVSSLLLALSLVFIGAGRNSFAEIRGIFDGLALFFLVCSMYFKNPLLVFSGVFLSAWTDERGLIASAMVFLFWIYSNDNRENKIISKQTIAILIAWIAYFISRYYLTVKFNLVTSSVDVLYYFIEQTNNLPIGIWSALEGNWILVLLSLFILFKEKKYFFLSSYSIAISIMLFVAMSVFDIGRSMAYMMPAIFVSLQIVHQVESKKILQQIILVVTLVSFLYPAYVTAGDYFINWNYPLPLQILRHIFASGK